MLFPSPIFLFAFLPVTLAGFWILARTKRVKIMALWLLACSIVFYGWDTPAYVILLTGSALGNYFLGTRIAQERSGSRLGKQLLITGVAGNLALLFFFKYLGFAADIFRDTTGLSFAIPAVALPLGISFFTFQQIAFLADVHRGDRSAAGGDRYPSWPRYLLFVSFFPQLIAGPIVKGQELLPQLKELGPLVGSNLAIGLGLFAIGLFKKVVIADGLAGYANPVFDGAAVGVGPDLIGAWIAILAYTMQIYFDFSAYTDMALGLARMFGIKLPENFVSPYKSTSIIDFWRRWHVTLSRFLRDYLYVPLGGNRKGAGHIYLNLMIVMVLGGLWHGAGWGFLAWGAFHGAALVVAHAWRSRERLSPNGRLRRVPAPIGWAATFCFITLTWVLFRSENLQAAGLVYRGLVGAFGVDLPWRLSEFAKPLAEMLNLNVSALGSLSFAAFGLATIISAMAVAFFLPRATVFMETYVARWQYPGRPLPILGLSVLTAICSIWSVSAILSSAPNSFIYFRF